MKPILPAYESTLKTLTDTHKLITKIRRYVVRDSQLGYSFDLYWYMERLQELLNLVAQLLIQLCHALPYR
jgi:hypothetical protein